MIGLLFFHHLDTWLEGVALKPDLNQDDGMHPNEKGTLIISNTVKKSTISFIKEANLFKNNALNKIKI